MARSSRAGSATTYHPTPRRAAAERISAAPETRSFGTFRPCFRGSIGSTQPVFAAKAGRAPAPSLITAACSALGAARYALEPT
jgi:hypothetical protein